MDNRELKYFNIDWASEYDGPGIRTVLYLQGCRLDCPWCHTPNSKPQNPPVLFLEHLCAHCGQCIKACLNNCHSLINGKHEYNYENCQKCLKCITACPHSNINEITGALVYTFKVKTVDELFEILYPQLLFLKKSGGITISGGEALIQHKSVGRLLNLCKDKGINTAIETSGNVSVSSVSNLYNGVDNWLIGLHPWTNKGYGFNSKIYLLLDFLTRRQANILIRMPFIPGYTDTDKAIQTQCEILNRFNIRRIELLSYNQYTSLYYNALGIDKPSLNQESDFSRLKDLFAIYNIEYILTNQ